VISLVGGMEVGGGDARVERGGGGGWGSWRRNGENVYKLTSIREKGIWE